MSTRQRIEAGPSQGRRRTNKSGGWQPGSDDDTHIKTTGRRYGRQRAPERSKSEEDEQARSPPQRRTAGGRSRDPDPRIISTTSPIKQNPTQFNNPSEAFEEEMRRAIALSLQEPPSTGPPEDNLFDTAMRRAMTRSKAEAEASARPSTSTDPDAEYLRMLRESQKEHEAQQRERARKDKKAAQIYETEMARLLQETRNDVCALIHQRGDRNEDDELEEALRLSMETAAEEQRKAAERMAWSRSWTENNPCAAERGDRPPAITSLDDSPALSSEPAADPPKPKPNKVQDLLSRKKKPRTTALDAVLEDAVATLPSPALLRTGTSPGRVAESTTDQATAVHKPKPMPEMTSQALNELQESPIKIETLIAMCERAFPKDHSMEEALKLSKTSWDIDRAQNGLDEDAVLASVIAESMVGEAQPADIQETGVVEGEEAPPYRQSAQDKVIDHFKYTSSDYRNEKAGTKMVISKEIWEIMAQYKEFVAWARNIDPKGKSKDGQLVITPPPPSDSSITDPSAPAEVTSSLAEISRPGLREDFQPPKLEASSNIMAAVLPAHRALQQRMQNQSRMIGQSRFPGSRPRVKPEAHLTPFSRLPIMIEENEQVVEASRGQMGKATARKVKMNANYKRSGL
ncbi:MAG: hypothetical protein Q9171_002383 [Xanthocarpia ochracea]